MEQRNGRIDRYGQKHSPVIGFLYAADSYEGEVMKRLVLKIEAQVRKLVANLDLFAALYGIGGKKATTAIDAALELVGLRDRAKDKVATFSGGMKRRLNLAGALLQGSMSCLS